MLRGAGARAGAGAGGRDLDRDSSRQRTRSRLKPAAKPSPRRVPSRRPAAQPCAASSGAAAPSIAGTVAVVHLVELEEVTDEQWAEIIGDEIEPWGGGVGERMSWREKGWYVAAESWDDTLAALAGATVAGVDVEGDGSFDVLGIGGVFVRASKRGHGLALLVVKELLRRAEEDTSSVDRAMLFCRPHLTGLYRKFGFREIEAPVWAEQPDGRVEMPMPAMWRALAEHAQWPAGRVDLRGLPF